MKTLHEINEQLVNINSYTDINNVVDDILGLKAEHCIDPFWGSAHRTLLIAAIGYFYETDGFVLDLKEIRDFINKLIVNADNVKSEFDFLFRMFGRNNPKSTAYHHYKSFRLAPEKFGISVATETINFLEHYYLNYKI